VPGESAVIPSGARAKRTRRRGIAVIPKEGLAPGRDDRDYSRHTHIIEIPKAPQKAQSTLKAAETTKQKEL
jgi:hypothetical protein